MSARILLRFGRREDADAALVETKSSLKYKCDLERIDDELCDFGRARQILFHPISLMLCRLYRRNAVDWRHRQLHVLQEMTKSCFREIRSMESISVPRVLRKLAWTCIFCDWVHIPIPYRWTECCRRFGFGFSFGYMGGNRFFMHSNLYPNFVAPPEFQSGDSPNDPLPRRVLDETHR